MVQNRLAVRGVTAPWRRPVPWAHRDRMISGRRGAARDARGHTCIANRGATMVGRSPLFGISRAGYVPAALLVSLLVSACTPDYSPNTYNAGAVQQANKTEQGVVVGVRQVDVKTAGTTGAVVGGAAGGIARSQVGSGRHAGS